MNDVLLTVSGVIDPEIRGKIERGERPLADYIAMADSFQADLIDYNGAAQQANWFGKLLGRIGGRNLLLAWVCYQLRHRYRVIFTDGEQIGIPLAFLLKFFTFGDRPQHQMIVHILSVGKKMLFFDKLGIQSHVDLFFVYATWQKKFIEERWNVPSQRVVFTPFMVDSHFFAPSQAGGSGNLLGLRDEKRPILCAVGLEFRDYPTLIEAVRGLNVVVVIAAASPWSKRSDSTEGQDVPDNVIIHRFTQFELRDLYVLSNFLVMPLYNVNFQAGVTALLEAMALEKAVVCSRTPGQTDVVVEGETGLYVTPEDPTDLRRAIVYLLEHPDEAERMGKNGRRRIDNYMSLEQYVLRLNEYVQPYGALSLATD